MRLRIAIFASLAVLLFAAAGNAAGVFGGSSSEVTLQQRFRALVQRAEEKALPGAGEAAVASSSVRRGPRGPRGARGPKGETGAQGSFSTITRVKGNPVYLAPFPEVGAVGTSTAVCPPGTTAISGGWTGLGILATIGYSSGFNNQWTLIATNNNEFNGVTMIAEATCVS